MPEGQVHTLIVDGQQRTLSIHTAMYSEPPPTIRSNALKTPLGLHVNILTGTFRFHNSAMQRSPQWMPVSAIGRDDAESSDKMEAALRPH